ncbi:flagellar hook-associated protein FlgK [Bacillus sp. APMAM]|nr:flagellar hook-associated protein FlgK [Bacillus sp. APMAM]RTZ55029.1 flagellar hook-associated protein FlgK [Bacillus sp. SAJ1]
MLSTFFGLEIAKRGMNTQQNALFVTGQNISNANTPGYSRQRVNFEATEAFPAAAMNRPQIPGQMGTGVQAGSVQRIREAFLDQQYRGENNKLGYWNSRAESLSKMEDILNEPSDSGLSAVLGQFWQSLQDLSVHPENDGARSVVLQRGQSVADTFHYLSDSLSSIQQDIGNQVGVTIKDINSILDQISSINKQISEIEPHGYLPNELYDERDRLVDQLSSYMNIKVEKTSSGGNPSPLAEGIYNIKMVNSNNQEVYLVQGTNANKLGIVDGIDSDGDSIPDEPKSGQMISAILVGGTKIDFADSNGQVGFSQGKLKALIESYGYQYSTTDSNGSPMVKTAGIYPDALDKLDKLAYTFGSIFNEVHKKGYGSDGSTGNNFFDLSALVQADGTVDYHGAAKLIALNSDLTKEMIAASDAVITDKDGKVTGVESGNGKNALNLSHIQDLDLSNFDPDNDSDIEKSNIFTSGTIMSNYQGIIGKLGVDAQQADRMTKNSGTLVNSVDQNRQSITSVSLDEEMINMIKFQQAYNASARNITIVDEMLDKIINGLGTGGR